MKRIEIIYAVMNEDNGEEAICGLSMGGMPMQAASSKLEKMQNILAFLEKSCPEKKFWIKKFISEDTIK